MRLDRKQDAARVFCMLVKSNLAPKGFSVTLMLQGIELLMDKDVVVGVGDTYELMRCLEELCLQQREVKDVPEIGNLRMALTRNLSRALVSA